MSNNSNLNGSMREIFTKVMSDGYKKNHICALTLGTQCVPQFDGFVKGRDFGIKPLERVLGAFDYEIHMVPVRKTDHEAISKIDQMTNDCLEDVSSLLITSLDKESLRVSASKKNPIIKEHAEGILKELGIATAEV